VPNSSSGSIVLAAVILGVAVMGGAYMVSSSVDAGIEELAGVRTALADLEGSFEAAAAPSRPAPERSRRPDPGKEYSIDVKGAPTLGPKDAKIEIVEFSDFQCPFCSRVWPTLQQVRDEYPEQVRIVFKHLPLRIHPNAPAAHAAAEAAHRQGKFWEMHDAIFANPRELSPERYEQYATEMGIDLEQFKTDVASASVKARVDADQSEAAKLGVSGTPSFFINGRYLSGAQPFEEFKKRIDEELAKG
jgi:protein-disulfide isomerase